VLTLEALREEMMSVGLIAEYLFVIVAAGGGPVTVTVAVPHSQGLPSV
jgi:hypothetical protein